MNGVPIFTSDKERLQDLFREILAEDLTGEF